MRGRGSRITRTWGMAGADSRTGSWGVRIGLDIHNDTEDGTENARCGCTTARLVLRRQLRGLRDAVCRAAVGELYTRLFASLPTGTTRGDNFQSRPKNRAMQSSQRNGLVSTSDKNILSAMLRLDWRTLELPQCGQFIARGPYSPRAQHRQNRPNSQYRMGCSTTLVRNLSIIVLCASYGPTMR
jgi:hypothetical protein